MHYVLIKDFNTFIYDYTLHRGRKNFCRDCLQAFSTREILKNHVNVCFKINGKQIIEIPKKGEYVKLKYCEGKIKSDIESILVPEDSGKQNQVQTYKIKHQKHDVCSYVSKLVCAGDKFSKPFKSYPGEDTVYNFITSKLKESKYCSDAMKKHFNKELVMTKKDDDDFQNSTKCWIVIMIILMAMLK